MDKVFFHFKNPGQTHWENEAREFLRVPTVGEIVARNRDDWYRVGLVVHAAGDYEAEIYAVTVDRHNEMRQFD